MENILEMQHITKIFPRIIANDDISFNLEKGEIHALLGENGAGKSTLMSVLFGLYPLDGGQIIVRGKEVQINNPLDANRFGYWHGASALQTGTSLLCPGKHCIRCRN